MTEKNRRPLVIRFPNHGIQLRKKRPPNLTASQFYYESFERRNTPIVVIFCPAPKS